MADHMAVDDHDVLPAVVVQVQKARPEADVLPAQARQSHGLTAELEERYVPNRQVAIQVAIQSVQLILVVGDQQGGPAAAVVISRVDPHASVGQPVLVPRHPG